MPCTSVISGWHATTWITVLGVLILRAQGATTGEQALLAATVAAAYGASFFMLPVGGER